MIPYQQLCEALDRYNGRRHNQQELDQLEQVEQVEQYVEPIQAEPELVAPQQPARQRDTAPQFYSAAETDGAMGEAIASAAEDGDPSEVEAEVEAEVEDPTMPDPPRDGQVIEPVATQQDPIELATQELELEDAEGWDEVEPRDREPE